MGRQHFEPFVVLADVTHDSALISWGGFFFRQDEVGGREGFEIVDDEELGDVQTDREESIGACSEPYGHAVVEIRDSSDLPVARAETRDANHVWVRGLEPNREYRYRVLVDGRPWAEDALHEWVQRERPVHGLVRSGRVYDLRFRTHPAPDAPVPLTFAVIGDFGIGVRTASDDGVRQATVARALERAVDLHDVRFVLTVGDNIYLGPESDAGIEGTGNEDDDWYFTYYEPYRHVISRLPVYPAVGNHDSSEQEDSDDRRQLEDNFFLTERFREEEAPGRASLDPGLFYTFGFGRDVRFVCIDTTLADDLPEERYFQHPKHLSFLESALPPAERIGGAHAPWVIPFSHHPAFCAGPHHDNNEHMVRHLVPMFERAGVRLALAGHEHNFQHSVHRDAHYFITGAGGKLRAEVPTRFADAHVRAWCAEGHFLLVHVDAEKAIVQPIARVGEDGELVPPLVLSPDGTPTDSAVVIPRRPR